MAKSLYAREGATSDIVSTQVNATGVWDTILTIDPTDGTVIELLNRVATGDAAGIPLFAKFKDGGDADLPGDTELRFKLSIAGQRQDLIVSEEVGTIQQWNQLALTEQQNADTIDAVKIELEEPGSEENVRKVNVRDVDEFTVEIRSSTAIDHSYSSLLFGKSAVNERPK